MNIKKEDKPILVEYPETTNRMEKIVISLFNKEKKFFDFSSKIRSWEDFLIKDETKRMTKKSSKKSGSKTKSNPNPNPGPSPISSTLNKNGN